jgi:hypothetical protein
MGRKFRGDPSDFGFLGGNRLLHGLVLPALLRLKGRRRGVLSGDAAVPVTGGAARGRMTVALDLALVAVSRWGALLYGRDGPNMEGLMLEK